MFRPPEPWSRSSWIILAFAWSQAALLTSCEFGPIGRAAPHHSDIGVPAGIGRRMLAGEVPYRDFLVEYPPLALPFFWLAAWLGPSGARFAWAFAAEVLLFHTATLVLVGRSAGRNPVRCVPAARLGWFLLFTVALWPVMLTRYDPIPTFFAFAAVVAWRAGRPGLAGVGAGLGFLIKLFPGFVLFPQVARDWRQVGSAAGRARLGLGITLALGITAWFVVGHSGVGASIAYHRDRRIEVESIFASLIFLADLVLGRTPIILNNFSAFHLMGDLPDLFALLSFPLLCFALFAIGMQVAPDADPIRTSCVSLLAFLVTNKVLSPQYLIWLIPFIATLEGRRSGRVRVLFAACCLLTTLNYPYHFGDLIAAQPLAILIVGVRNVILLLVTLGVWHAAPDPTAALHDESVQK